MQVNELCMVLKSLLLNKFSANVITDSIIKELAKLSKPFKYVGILKPFHPHRFPSPSAHFRFMWIRDQFVSIMFLEQFIRWYSNNSPLYFVI